MRQYEMKELAFRGKEPEESQVKVDVKAVFSCEGKSTEVKGFYAGNGAYKVRFYPKDIGTYKWEVSGAVSGEGAEECVPASGSHGRVQADGLHFKYEDGSRYIPIGTTIYAMIHQKKELVETTMETLKNAAFNKVRFCVFPKSYDYNANEPELFPFEKKDGKWDVHRPCFPFWDMLESYVCRLGQMGIEADIILFHPYDRWGFAELSKEECLAYLDYAVRRLSAFPNVWWSLANEYDIMFEFAEDWWAEFAAFIHRQDHASHCLSNHNFIKYWDFSDQNTTHCCIQGGCVGDVGKLRKKYGKPVIFDECGYEGNIPHAWGNLSAFELVNRFWTAYTLGGYCTHGETYLNDKDILWWSKGGELHGESPKRIAFLKDILYSLPGEIEYKASKIDEFLQEEDRELLEERAKSDDLTKMLIRLPRETVCKLAENIPEIQGHCGDEAYLFYYGRQCKGFGMIELPETGSYRIEIIDVWEMTREGVLSGVNGRVSINLPGKEGIGVLALKERQNSGTGLN